jgi:hypothetical protein
VTFDVVDTTADSIHIKGEHSFTRKQVGVGKDGDDPVGPDLKVAIDLTLKNT